MEKQNPTPEMTNLVENKGWKSYHEGQYTFVSNGQTAIIFNDGEQMYEVWDISKMDYDPTLEENQQYHLQNSAMNGEVQFVSQLNNK